VLPFAFLTRNVHSPILLLPSSPSLYSLLLLLIVYTYGIVIVLCITHVRRARDSHCLIVAVGMSRDVGVGVVEFVVAVRVSKGSLALLLPLLT